MSYDILINDGETKTDLYCTECGKNFIALIDYSINGNHHIFCPWCNHEHCRVVKDGMVTSDRFSTTTQGEVIVRKVWKNPELNMTTMTTSLFLRHKWLDMGNL